MILYTLMVFFSGCFVGMIITCIAVAGKRSEERALPNLPDFDEWAMNRDYVPMWFLEKWFLEKWFGDNYNALTDLQMEWKKECRK